MSKMKDHLLRQEEKETLRLTGKPGFSQRIAACLEACHGISTEALEHGVVADVLAALGGLRDGVIASGTIALPPVLEEPQPWVLITAEALRKADLAHAAVEEARATE